VASLMGLGWKPGSPTSWTDPDGIQWDIDPGAPGVAVQLKAVVAEFIGKDLWRQACQHEGGRGLENGADLTVARRMRRHFLEQGELNKARILELICQGASWPPARKAAADLPVDPTCTFCRLAPGTVKHQTWKCTGLLKAIGEDRAEGLELEATALRAEKADERPSWQLGRPPTGQRSVLEQKHPATAPVTQLASTAGGPLGVVRRHREGWHRSCRSSRLQLIPTTARRSRRQRGEARR
jgi:hypothetical protein